MAAVSRTDRLSVLRGKFPALDDLGSRACLASWLPTGCQLQTCASQRVPGGVFRPGVGTFAVFSSDKHWNTVAV